MVVMIMPTRDSDDELVLTMIANVPHAGDQVVGASESSKLKAIWAVGWWPMFRSTTNLTWYCNMVLYQHRTANMLKPIWKVGWWPIYLHQGVLRLVSARWCSTTNLPQLLWCYIYMFNQTYMSMLHLVSYV